MAKMIYNNRLSHYINLDHVQEIERIEPEKPKDGDRWPHFPRWRVIFNDDAEPMSLGEVHDDDMATMLSTIVPANTAVPVYVHQVAYFSHRQENENEFEDYRTLVIAWQCSPLGGDFYPITTQGIVKPGFGHDCGNVMAFIELPDGRYDVPGDLTLTADEAKEELRRLYNEKHGKKETAVEEKV